jgi:hypothetical protein
MFNAVYPLFFYTEIGIGLVFIPIPCYNKMGKETAMPPFPTGNR